MPSYAEYDFDARNRIFWVNNILFGQIASLINIFEKTRFLWAIFL
jgi:hypothetical protein